jgi:hypothetical protein
MRNHEQSARPPQHAIDCPPDIFRIERRKALVENHHLRALKQRPGNGNAAAFPVRELAACLPNHLQLSRSGWLAKLDSTGTGKNVVVKHILAPDYLTSPNPALAHVRSSGRQIDPCSWAQSKHGLHPLQHTH